MRRVYIIMMLGVTLLLESSAFASDKSPSMSPEISIMSAQWNDADQLRKQQYRKHYHSQGRVYRPGAPKRHVQRMQHSRCIAKQAIRDHYTW